jgi:hypothetical protein
MNARSIPRTAVESSLRLVRVPLDAAIGWLPGNGTGARPKASLAFDRSDATVHAVAGQDQVARQRAKAELRANGRREDAERERQEPTRRADETERKNK